MMPAVSPPASRSSWRLVVPVRGGPAGKSRLTALEGRLLTEHERSELALAMARDTIGAALAAGSGSVVVLTGDEDVATLAAGCGAGVVADTGQGLNAELHAAAATHPSAGVCALLGDLPALAASDLVELLDAAEGLGAPGVFVPDWEETGTTCVAVPGPFAATPLFHFGPHSAERHRRAGLVPSALTRSRLRTDVDTPLAWDRAVGLGLGPATAEVRRRVLGR